MAHAVQRGNTYEIEAKKILEAEGWTVFRQHRKQMFLPREKKMVMVGCDVFGSDLIAKKPGSKTRWIQVTTRPQKSAKIKALMTHPWTFEHDTVQLWLRSVGKRAFEIFQAPEFESLGMKESI